MEGITIYKIMVLFGKTHCSTQLLPSLPLFYASITRLPLVLKGILTAEDAKLGVEAGAAAIWVSNHGARQVDGVPPTVRLFVFNFPYSVLAHAIPCLPTLSLQYSSTLFLHLTGGLPLTPTPSFIPSSTFFIWSSFILLSNQTI